MGQRPRRIVIVLKGYPRLSETFIAQEIRGLEQAGFDLALVSLRHPTDRKRHPVHDEIRAPVMYLPEYLYQEPWRVLRGLWFALRRPGFGRAFRRFVADLWHDPTPNRIRRFGQAAVLARELPRGADWLHAHFIHTPASATAYAAILTGLPWSCSAHAKDIWTAPDRDLAGKLAEMRWCVTCTASGRERLVALSAGHAPVHLSYHGLDLQRFGPPPDRPQAYGPVRIITVGRAVPKKGFDLLVEALGMLPPDLDWRFTHAGGGDVAGLKARAAALGIAGRITWAGAMDQPAVLALYRASDIFALPCRVTPDGDRDGLPNVLVEASSQRLACVSTTISGVPELIGNGVNGVMVPSEDAPALAVALETLIRDPGLRHRLGRAAEAKVRSRFAYHQSIRDLTALFGQGRGEP